MTSMRAIRSIVAGVIGTVAACGLLVLLRLTLLKAKPVTSPAPLLAVRKAPEKINTVKDNGKTTTDTPRRSARKPQDFQEKKPPVVFRAIKPKSSTPVKPQTIPAIPLPRPSSRPASPDRKPASSPVSGSFRAKMLDADKALAAGRNKESIALFREAVELSPSNPDALRGLAMGLLAAEQFQEAIDLYRKLIELAPEDRTARFNLALARAREGDFAEAEKTYWELLKRYPDFVQARANLGTLYQTQGKLGAARRQWSEVIRLSPKLIKGHEAMGEILMDLEKPAEAMEAFAEAAKLQPKQAAAWLNYAAAAAEAGSGGRALAALQQAIKLAPLDSEAWSMRGDMLLELYRAKNERKLLRQAVQAWKKSLEIDPSQDKLRELLKTYSRFDKAD